MAKSSYLEQSVDKMKKSRKGLFPLKTKVESLAEEPVWCSQGNSILPGGVRRDCDWRATEKPRNSGFFLKSFNLKVMRHSMSECSNRVIQADMSLTEKILDAYMSVQSLLVILAEIMI